MLLPGGLIHISEHLLCAKHGFCLVDLFSSYNSLYGYYYPSFMDEEQTKGSYMHCRLTLWEVVPDGFEPWSFCQTFPVYIPKKHGSSQASDRIGAEQERAFWLRS